MDEELTQLVWDRATTGVVAVTLTNSQQPNNPVHTNGNAVRVLTEKGTV
jgi:hypothetical protein